MTIRGCYRRAAILHRAHQRAEAYREALIELAERRLRAVIDFASQRRYREAETRMLRAGLVAFKREKAALAARIEAYERMMFDPREEQDRQKRESAWMKIVRRNVS